MTMYQRVMDEIDRAQGAISVIELSRRLEIEPSALAGMLHYWARKGRFRIEGGDEKLDLTLCASHCSGSGMCSSSSQCPLATSLPRHYRLAMEDKQTST